MAQPEVLPRELLDRLRCPKCLGALVEARGGLGCQACALLFPVKDGIFNMFVEDAQLLK